MFVSFKLSPLLPDPSTCQCEVNCFLPFHLKCLGVSLSFSRNLELGFSPSSGFSDSTFLISSSSAFFFSSEVCCSLSISLTLAVRRSSSSAWTPFYLIFSGPCFLDKEIEDWKPALDLDLFLVFQTIRMELIS